MRPDTGPVTAPGHRILRAIGLALILTLFATLNGRADQPTEADLKRLEAAIESTREQLADYQGRARDTEEALRKSETLIGRLSRELRSLQTRIRREQKKLEALRAEREQLQARRREQETRLEKQLREAWRLGREKKLRVLLNQERPENLSRSLAYYHYFNQARLALLTKYQSTLTRLDAVEPAIVQTTRELQQARESLLDQQAALKQEQAARQALLARLQRSIRTTDEELARLQEERKALEDLLNAVEETLANMKIPSEYRPFTELRGALPWPVPGRVVARYGTARGSQMRWRGMLISAGEGTEVQAVHHGRVVFADWFRGMGLLLIIDHGNDFLTLYAHNQSLLRTTGDWVTAGETVATVGNSGGRERAALYFEIRHRGKPQDPADWIRRG